MRIYLLGMMGSGKTTVGKKLANKLAYQFMDLDDLIEQKLSMSVTDFFEKEGEEKFRIIEQGVLRETFQYNKAVISTGGGTPCFFSNISEINQNGISCYLKADVGMLASRLQGSIQQRPLIKNRGDQQQLKEYLREMLIKRETFYYKAQKIVEAIDISADKLIQVLGLSKL